MSPLTKSLLEKKDQSQTKPLVAMHNMSTGNLIHTDELGGIAAPSIAVVDSNYPLEGFGDVSLLASRDMVDPELGVPVFAADIYSPRYPSFNYKVKDKPLREIQDYIAPFAEEMGASVYGLDQEISDSGAAGAARSRKFEYPLKLAFLRERGVNFTAPMIEAPPHKWYPWAHHPLMRQFVESHGGAVYDTDIDGEENYKKFSNIVKQAIQAHYHDTYSPLFDDEEDGEMYRNMYRRGLEGALNNHFNEEGELLFGVANATLRELGKIGKLVPDGAKYEEAIQEAFKNVDPTDFEQWAISKLKPAEGDKYIPRITDSGNRRAVPYSLTNILREMTRTKRGGEGGNYGLGSIRAHAAPQFRTLEGLRSMAYRILPPEEFKQVKEEADDRFTSLARRAQGHYRDSDSFRGYDAFGNAIADSFGRGKSLQSRLKTYGFNLPPDLVQEVAEFAASLRSMPTEYFEAKPQRIVTLDEFKGAAVPSDAAQAVRDILSRQGVKYEVYNRDQEGSRAKAIQNIAQSNNLYLSEHPLTLEILSKALVHNDPTNGQLHLNFRGVRKSEPLSKSTPAGLKLFDRLRSLYEDQDRKKLAFDSAKHFNGGRGWNHPSREVEEALAAAPLVVHFPTHRVFEISREGRFKNLFETGHGMGTTDEGIRRAREEEALGIPRDTPILERPVYGAVHPLHGHPLGVQGAARQYGDSYAILKPQVRDRSTLTATDSFGVDTGPGEVFLRTQMPQWAEWWRNIAPASKLVSGIVDGLKTGDGRWYPSSYSEAQVYGGIDLSQDVAGLVTPYWDEHSQDEKLKMQQGVIDTGKKYNIPVFGIEEEKIRPIFEPTKKTELNPLTLEVLAKSKPGPRFPKLGLSDDRRETPIIKPQSLSHQVKARAIANATIRLPEAQQKFPTLKNLTEEDRRELAGIMSKQWIGDRNIHGLSQTGQTTLSYALDYKKDPRGPISTKIHEDAHNMFSRLGANRTRVVGKLLENLTPEEFEAIRVFKQTRDPDGGNYDKEEYITHLLNYLNSPEDRERFYQGMEGSYGKIDRRKFDQAMKGAYRNIINNSKRVKMKKSEFSPLTLEVLSKTTAQKVVDI